jgi:hypothetical protein
MGLLQFLSIVLNANTSASSYIHLERPSFHKAVNFGFAKFSHAQDSQEAVEIRLSKIGISRMVEDFATNFSLRSREYEQAIPGFRFR